jgi:hypothetical protein
MLKIVHVGKYLIFKKWHEINFEGVNKEVY